MAIEDLGPAERLTAGAVGPPGQRTFYIQVTAGGIDHWLQAEKEQVTLLASEGMRILDQQEIRYDPESVGRLIDMGLDLQEPPEDEIALKVGDISMSLAGSSLLLLTIHSVDEEDRAISFVVAPEQFRAMATVALKVAASGRPICQWCRLPKDPDRHECPARN